MNKYLILLLAIVLASCNTFDRMKYRHLKKVPATPQEFPVDFRSFDSISAKEPVVSLTKERHAVFSNDTSFTETIFADTIRSQGIILHCEEMNVPEKLNAADVQQLAKHGAQIKRDWSLLIGALLILGGLFMLMLCIFYFPTAGISFLWTIAFELASLFAAWRMLGTGVMYFVTRFRRRNNFSER